MALVDVSIANWLKSGGLKAVATAVLPSGFADLAVESSVSCPLAEQTAAQEEAARQIEFLGSTRVVDSVRVPGRRVDLIGQAITLTCSSPGYRTGTVVFVIGAQEIDGDAGTRLRVIRRLA